MLDRVDFLNLRAATSTKYTGRHKNAQIFQLAMGFSSNMVSYLYPAPRACMTWIPCLGSSSPRETR